VNRPTLLEERVRQVIGVFVHGRVTTPWPRTRAGGIPGGAAQADGQPAGQPAQLADPDGRAQDDRPDSSAALEPLEEQLGSHYRLDAVREHLLEMRR
jgi:hypothetical protein